MDEEDEGAEAENEAPLQRLERVIRLKWIGICQMVLTSVFRIDIMEILFILETTKSFSKNPVAIMLLKHT